MFVYVHMLTVDILSYNLVLGIFVAENSFYDKILFDLLLFQGGHVITPLPGATPTKPGSAVS